MNEDYELHSFKRGDTFAFCIPIEAPQPITIEEIETLYCTCRKFPEETSPIIFQKELKDMTVDNEGIHIVIKPEDTENENYGTYYFDVELTLKTRYRATYVGMFELLYETSIHKKEGAIDGRN